MNWEKNLATVLRYTDESLERHLRNFLVVGEGDHTQLDPKASLPSQDTYAHVLDYGDQAHLESCIQSAESEIAAAKQERCYAAESMDQKIQNRLPTDPQREAITVSAMTGQQLSSIMQLCERHSVSISRLGIDLTKNLQETYTSKQEIARLSQDLYALQDEDKNSHLARTEIESWRSQVNDRLLELHQVTANLAEQLSIMQTSIRENISSSDLAQHWCTSLESIRHQLQDAIQTQNQKIGHVIDRVNSSTRVLTSLRDQVHTIQHVDIVELKSAWKACNLLLEQKSHKDEELNRDVLRNDLLHFYDGIIEKRLRDSELQLQRRHQEELEKVRSSAEQNTCRARICCEDEKKSIMSALHDMLQKIVVENKQKLRKYYKKETEKQRKLLMELVAQKSGHHTSLDTQLDQMKAALSELRYNVDLKFSRLYKRQNPSQIRILHEYSSPIKLSSKERGTKTRSHIFKKNLRRKFKRLRYDVYRELKELKLALGNVNDNAIIYPETSKNTCASMRLPGKAEHSVQILRDGSTSSSLIADSFSTQTLESATPACKQDQSQERAVQKNNKFDAAAVRVAVDNIQQSTVPSDSITKPIVKGVTAEAEEARNRIKLRHQRAFHDKAGSQLGSTSNGQQSQNIISKPIDTTQASEICNRDTEVWQSYGIFQSPVHSPKILDQSAFISSSAKLHASKLCVHLPRSDGLERIRVLDSSNTSAIPETSIQNQVRSYQLITAAIDIATNGAISATATDVESQNANTLKFEKRNCRTQPTKSIEIEDGELKSDNNNDLTKAKTCESKRQNGVLQHLQSDSSNEHIAQNIESCQKLCCGPDSSRLQRIDTDKMQEISRKTWESEKCCYCSIELPMLEIMNHGIRCGQVLRQCPHCLKKHKSRELANHMENCDYRLLPCPNECGVRVLQRGLKKHLDIDCLQQHVSKLSVTESTYSTWLASISGSASDSEFIQALCNYTDQADSAKDLDACVGHHAIPLEIDRRSDTIVETQDTSSVDLSCCKFCSKNYTTSTMTVHMAECTSRPSNESICTISTKAEMCSDAFTVRKLTAAKVPPPPSYPPPDSESIGTTRTAFSLTHPNPSRQTCGRVDCE